MSQDDIRQAIFGGLDGLSSALGVIVALAISHPSTVLVAAVALGVGAAVSMAAGEWLSDPQASHRRAGIMGLATLTGALAPALPFAAGHGAGACIACGLIAVALAALIAELRPEPRAPSYARTFGLVAVASGAAVGTSLLAGGAG